MPNVFRRFLHANKRRLHYRLSMWKFCGAARFLGTRVRIALRPVSTVIELTPAAVKRVGILLSSNDSAIGLRLGVKSRGCNGMSYTMDYMNQGEEVPKAMDVVEQDGVRVFIEPKALMHVIGTTMVC